MKVAALLFLLVCASALGSQRIFEDKIKKFIKNLAEKLRNEGIPEMNIPPLDPLDMDNLNVDINLPSLAELNLNMSSVHETGITHFDITNLTFNLVGMQFTYGFKWPEIFMQADYSLNGQIGGGISVTGNGNFSILAHQLEIFGSGKLTTNENKFVRVSDFHIFFGLHDLRFNVTGLIDAKTSKLISAMVTALAPNFVKDHVFRPMIDKFLSPIVVEEANKLIGNRTIGDIIGGLGRDNDELETDNDEINYNIKYSSNVL